MRIKMIFNDCEYCRALADEIASVGKGIVIEIGEPWNTSVDRNTIILTDYTPESLNLCDWSNVVFLTNNPKDELKDDYAGEAIRLFKYKSINSILSDLEHINCLLRGNTDSSLGVVSRVFAICSDSSDKSKALARILARQVIFRKGGDVVIVPLGFINKYPCADESNKSRFSRWMFYMDVGRTYSIDSFLYSDSYGIGYLRLPTGLNPISYMHSSQVARLIAELSSKKYETIILDVGNCFSEMNISILNRADNILYFVDDESSLDAMEIINKPENDEKLKIVPIAHISEDIEMTIDEYLIKLYGIDNDEVDNDKKSDG